MGSVGPYPAPEATIMLKSQTITCRGVVLWGEGQSPQVEEIEVEGPKNGEVRVKMLFASLCHTDVLCSRGFPSAMFPRVLGHEGAGMVESVGDGVKGLKEGDVVIPTYLGECRECENCVSGQTNMCYTYPLQAFTGLMSDSTSRMQAQKRPLYHFLSCSTWCEYTVVDANYLVKIDPRIPLHHASFLSCGFSTGFGAAWKEAPILRKGSSVAVFGLGAVGLGAVEGARVQGAARIIGVDINDIKSEKAKGFGLTDFINPSNYPGKSVADIIKELTGGMGVDFSFECTGVPALVNPAVDCTKVGIGKMVMLGAGTYKTLEMDFIPLLSGRTFRYAVFGGVKVQSDLPTIIDKCINKEIKDLDQLLSYEVELEDINKGFKLLKEPDCIKVLIKF